MTETDMEIQQLRRDNAQMKKGLKNLRVILEKQSKECEELRMLYALKQGECSRLRRQIEALVEEKEDELLAQ